MISALSNHHLRGMTLIELLVVMTMLAMLAGLFPLALQRVMPARRLAAAASSLTLQLRDLQFRSAMSGLPLQLRLEASGFSVQQVHVQDGKHIRWTDIEATLKPQAGAQPVRAITMHPDGSSSGGEFELRSGPHQVTVTVSSLTGHVRRSR